MPGSGPIERIDHELGRAVERAVAAHHRRRLRRLGWERALDAPAGGWAEGAPGARPGNALEIHVDGANALPRLAADIAGAQESVHLAGWHFQGDFQLDRAPVPLTVKHLLAETAERVPVRVLAWAGAPLPLFHPSRREVRRDAERLTEDTAIRMELDSKERPFHCHHEKITIIDGRIAWVGGIDLSALAGDRFDSSTHPARSAVGWHDATTRIEGPAVADVAAHFALRWREVAGETLREPAPPAAAGELELQIVATVPERIYDAVPRGSFRILESYVRALRSAERLIYLENQFLWSPEIVAVLAEKLRRPPSDEFRLLLMLPSHPNNGRDDTRGMLAELIAADGDAGRVLACTLYARRGKLADPVYVHAKIGIVDDCWLTLGSANLNEHSLFNDTELNVVCHDEATARALRLRLWAEHLERPESEVAGPAHEVVDGVWRPLAEEGLRRRLGHEPLEHRLARLPHVSKRSARLKGPLNGLLVDG